MREIKFRGKRKDNGKWVYGCYVQRSHKDCCVYHYIYTGHYFEDENQSGTELEVYEVIPETVGQFVCKDKNGKDMFEWDNTNHGRIKWSPAEWAWAVVPDDEMKLGQLLYECASDIEIIEEKV